MAYPSRGAQKIIRELAATAGGCTPGLRTLRDEVTNDGFRLSVSPVEWIFTETFMQSRSWKANIANIV
jgi:hypothetical protein